jgi:hypothetical protein
MFGKAGDLKIFQPLYAPDTLTISFTVVEDSVSSRVKFFAQGGVLGHRYQKSMFLRIYWMKISRF